MQSQALLPLLLHILTIPHIRHVAHTAYITHITHTAHVLQYPTPTADTVPHICPRRLLCRIFRINLFHFKVAGRLLYEKPYSFSVGGWILLPFVRFLGQLVVISFKLRATCAENRTSRLRWVLSWAFTLAFFLRLLPLLLLCSAPILAHRHAHGLQACKHSLGWHFPFNA